MKTIAVVLALGVASTGELSAQSTPAPSSPSSTAEPAAQTGATEPTVRLDITNFCCPDYLAALKKSVAENWQAPPDIAGTTAVRFVIERNGQISKAEMEQSSGVADVDERALRAVRLTKPAPLPAAFNQQTLTVHLTFAWAPPPGSQRATTLGEALKESLERFVSQGDLLQTIEFDTQGVDFGPWIRRFMAQVKRNWFVPSAALTQKGRTVVTFSVSKAGVIRNVKVVQPSGVAQFDQSASNAVLNANPLEPLPPAYPRDEVQFTVSFYYNDRPPAK